MCMEYFLILYDTFLESLNVCIILGRKVINKKKKKRETWKVSKRLDIKHLDSWRQLKETRYEITFVIPNMKI